MTGQSRNAAKHAITTILDLEASLDHEKKRAQDLEKMLAARSSDLMQVATIGADLRECKESVECLAKSIKNGRKALGVDDCILLQRLKNNEFLRLRVNAQVLRIQIRDKLRQCKFEQEQLGDSYRSTINGISMFLIKDNVY